MDVGPTRSMGFTPNAIERITPADALVRDDARPAADGAAPAAEDATPVSDRTLIQRLDELRRSGASPAADANEEASQRPGPPLTKAQRNMQRLMDKVAGPLRSYLEDGPLSDDDKKALVEALTQFESDVGRLSETIDVEQLNEEMQAAFERFYVSLKRIFGASGEQEDVAVGEEANRPAEAMRPDDALGATGSPNETASRDDDAQTLMDDSTPSTAIPMVGEEEALGPDTASFDEAYRRIASMYTALYASSDDHTSSLNEKG